MSHAKQPLTAAEQTARWQRAVAEGRFQQALDLAKQLYTAGPSPESLERLKESYFGRAIQLREQGQIRDAATVLEVAARHDAGNADWLGRLAREMAGCGDLARTEALLQRVAQLGGHAGANLTATIHAQLADASILDDKLGRDGLPAEWHRDHDQVVAAFAHLEAGRDEEARQALQTIGVRSPFLEWKLFARGLLAYHQNDDARALENWGRLDPQRLPARLAAPFRAAIDVDYRQAQAPDTQRLLTEQLQRLAGGLPTAALTRLETAIKKRGKSLAEVFRAAEAVLPMLRASSPGHARRLASVLYWAILDTSPDDLSRYKRVFGVPPEDPEFHRLQAVAFDLAGEPNESHRFWHQYEQDVAARPAMWPEEDRSLVRALVWVHMGELASRVPDTEQFKKLPAFLRSLGGVPTPITPSERQCYEEALKLAPDLRGAHEGLLRLLARTDKYNDALKAGKRLLERFPDHVETMTELAALCYRRKKYASAIDYLERALRHHPLDRDIRHELLENHLAEARRLTDEGAYDQAVRHYQAALDYAEAAHQPVVLCLWAASRVKAGCEDEANTRIEQARQKAAGPLLIDYCLLVETNRLKLPTAWKTRLTKQFNTAVTASTPPSPRLALALTGYAAELVERQLSYHGMATHLKKIGLYAATADLAQFDEAGCARLYHQLSDLGASQRILDPVYRYGVTNYSNSPFFPYYRAIHLMGDSPDDCGPAWQIENYLNRAETLARQRPREEPGIKELLDDCRDRREMLRSLRPLFGGLMDLFTERDDD